MERIVRNMLEPIQESIERIISGKEISPVKGKCVIPEDKAVNGVDSEFICTICLNVLFDPIECNKCESCFCKVCIDNW